MLWTEGRSTPQGIEEEPVFHSTPGKRLKVFEKSDEMSSSESDSNLLTRAAIQSARNSIMWSITPPDEVIALWTVGNKPHYFVESLILNLFLMSGILMMKFFSGCMDKPSTQAESWCDSSHAWPSTEVWSWKPNGMDGFTIHTPC